MLSKKEKQWLAKVQKVLNECPKSLSGRAESFTIGDDNITLFDKSVYVCTERDVCVDVHDSGAELAELDFPFPVHSTAG